MVNTISNATHVQPAAQPPSTSTQKPTHLEPQSGTSGDSVQLSTAAQAMAAALQEARETPVQTAQEARNGDFQAQRLLARQAATKQE